MVSAVLTDVVDNNRCLAQVAFDDQEDQDWENVVGTCGFAIDLQQMFNTVARLRWIRSGLEGNTVLQDVIFYLANNVKRARR